MDFIRDSVISALTDLKGELVIIVDLVEMKVAAANRDACSLLGYDSAEISGLDLAEVVLCFKNSDENEKNIRKFSGNSYFSAFLTHDSDEIPVSFSFNTIPNDIGDFGVIIGRESAISTEIPGDSDLSLLQYKKALDSIYEGIVVIDRDFRIRLYNAPFRYLVEKFGYRGDLMDVPLKEAAEYITGKLGLEYSYVFRSGKSLDTSIKKEFGSEMLWYEVVKSPLVVNGEVTQVVSVIREITRQQELEQIKKESFFRIEKNMEQFAILNDHIRNPLQAIVGLADLEGGEYSKKIIECASEIDEIVKELDLGWIESDKIREMLLRHYGLKVTRRPNVNSPIGMLTVVGDEKNKIPGRDV